MFGGQACISITLEEDAGSGGQPHHAAAPALSGAAHRAWSVGGVATSMAEYDTNGNIFYVTVLAQGALGSRLAWARLPTAHGKEQQL